MKKWTALFLCLVICLTMAACGQTTGTDNTENENPSDTSDVSSAESGEPESDAQTPEDVPATKDWNVTPVVSKKIFYDTWPAIYAEEYKITTGESGVIVKDEATGKETKIADAETYALLFNGEQILFSQNRTDPTVKIDKDYVISYEDGKAIKPDKYEVEDIMLYDVKSGKTETLFSKYCAGGNCVYFDDDAVYYSDILESEIGFSADFDPYARQLYRYDRKTGDRSVISPAFEAKLAFAGDRPFLMISQGETDMVYDVANQKPLEINGFGSAYRWADDNNLYFAAEGETALTIWSYQIRDEKLEELYTSTIPEDLKYVDDFTGRYVLCGADISKEESQYTVTYGANLYTVYDLLTRKVIEIDPSLYDELFLVEGVLVSWLNLGDGTCEVAYYDDDGNRVVYDQVKTDELPDYQDARGYYFATETYDSNGVQDMKLVPYTLDFIK